MARTLAVKNFDQFQHYRDRSPPWIKLHQGVLEDYDFSSLPDAAKWHLAAIWLLASRSGNRIPDDPTWVAAKISARSKVDLDALVESGFLVVVSGATETVAECYQDASKTLERAEQSRGRAEQRIIAPIGAGVDVFETRFWKPYPRKVGKGAALKAWRAACKTADPEQIIAGLARFRWPDEPKFIPHPATWLNAQRWLDEPPEVRAGPVLARGPTLAEARAAAEKDRAEEVPLEERQRVGEMLGRLKAQLAAGEAA